MTQYLISSTTRGPLPAFQRGDVIASVDDNHTWGIRESLAEWVKSGRRASDWQGQWYIVKVPDQSFGATRAYGKTTWTTGPEDNPETLALARFRITLSELTPAEVSALETVQEITLNAARSNALILDRETNGRLGPAVAPAEVR